MRDDVNGNVLPGVRDIQQAARKEIAQEDRRAAIDAEKTRIRDHRARAKWWHRFIPIIIQIKRRDA